LCAAHASYLQTFSVADAWLTFGKSEARVKLLGFAVASRKDPAAAYETFMRAAECVRRRQDIERNRKILVAAKLSAWQALQSPLASYEAIRAPRALIERRISRDDTAKRRAEARFEELRSGSKVRIKAPAPPPVFTPEEVVELREMVRRLAETGAPDA
jgi:hypothetical protein